MKAAYWGRWWRLWHRRRSTVFRSWRCSRGRFCRLSHSHTGKSRPCRLYNRRVARHQSADVIRYTANKTYSEQNQFVKLNTFSPEMTQIPSLFFYNGGRKAQIIHCKLRLGMSDLNYDLLNRHLTTNSSCDCGEGKETPEHYILHCPRFTHTYVKTPYSNSLQIC